ATCARRHPTPSIPHERTGGACPGDRLNKRLPGSTSDADEPVTARPYAWARSSSSRTNITSSLTRLWIFGSMVGTSTTTSGTRRPWTDSTYIRFLADVIMVARRDGLL